MTQCRGERLDIGRKTRFTRFDSVLEIHRSLHLKLESPFSQSIVNEVYDTVVLGDADSEIPGVGDIEDAIDQT